MAESALAIHDLTVRYGKTLALSRISLKLPKGAMVGLVGPNGAGKSTLIKAILGLIPKESGSLSFFGHSLKSARAKVAYIPQRESVDWDFPLTVRDLVLMGSYGRLRLFQRPNAKDLKLAEFYLEKVGMSEYRDRQIGQLSGGQQQRAFFARALMQEADLYFLDEPFNGIDKCSELALIDIMRDLRSQGKTLMAVHHDLTTISDYFESIALLNVHLIAYGQVMDVFNPDNLLKTYGGNLGVFFSQKGLMGRLPC